MMRTLLAAGLSVFAAEASAISRYSAANMSCNEVQGVIQSDGAAIIYYRSKSGGAVPLYGRFVSDQNFCGYDEITETRYIPSADEASCPVRLCVENEFVPGKYE